MSGSGIRQVVREKCYERDGYLCTNPKCPQRDAVRVLADGKTVWKNRFWDGHRWRQHRLTLHHGLHRSEYFGEDRNEEWNLHSCCAYCHTDGGKEGLHTGNTELDEYFRELSLSRRPGGRDITIHRELASVNMKKPENEAKLRERAKRKQEYKDKLNRYRSTHGGLSPSQVAYRQKKEWKRRQEMKNI